jgi:hypothetical protein
MRPDLDKDRVRAQAELPLIVAPSMVPAIREAARRGLAVEASAADLDRRLVGEIGGLIAGLNKAMDVATAAGIDVVIVAHYQDGAPPGRKRCIVAGRMRRLSLDERV